jgi:hypothetical protein
MQRAVHAMLALAASAASMAACGSGTTCGDACANTAEVELQALASTFAMDLPLTLEVCLGTGCTSYDIVGHTLAMPTCSAVGTTTSVCNVDGQGTVVLSALPLPSGLHAGEAIAISATVTSGSAPLYHAIDMVTVVESSVEGVCGTCESAQATFTPTGQ